jgi:4-hydroxybenzoate polyprenyltransferase
MDEDAVNRPWRPLPSGRISQEAAAILRWLLVPLCVLVSLPFGLDMVVCSLMLAAALIAYNEHGLAHNWIGKSLFNAIGYGLFEYGAARIMSESLSRPQRV